MDNNETKKRKVLIVDDDSFLLDMYSMRFSQSGYEVETAMNAQEVMQKLHEGLVPDVCLFDVVMPVTDGFEMLENINKEKLIPSTIKIYLTNLGQEQDIAKGKSLGAASYIVKANSTPSEVVAHVNKVLEEHGL
ncbi:response regulator [Candidatus Nomurabacteria bacterium]|nr:response regulator [Candidatus Nomurabacteria bacterium]